MCLMVLRLGCVTLLLIACAGFVWSDCSVLRWVVIHLLHLCRPLVCEGGWQATAIAAFSFHPCPSLTQLCHGKNWSMVTVAVQGAPCKGLVFQKPHIIVSCNVWTTLQVRLGSQRTHTSCNPGCPYHYTLKSKAVSHSTLQILPNFLLVAHSLSHLATYFT
jgi:hypothetical protein